MEGKGMLRAAIESATEHLRSSYELVGGVEHDGEKGGFREFFMVNFLRPLLPHQFGVGSGVVVDASSRQSRQTDVIIYDRRKLPPLLLAGDRGLFPIDSVLCSIEVKSCMKADHFRPMIEAAQLLTTPEHGGLRIATPGSGQDQTTIYPLCAAFAYTSDAKEKDEFQRLEEQVRSGSDYLRVLCVLDKGTWVRGQEPHLSANRGQNAVAFVRALLNRLEEVSASRGHYRLQDWLP
jgi:hypothetical protein